MGVYSDKKSLTIGENNSGKCRSLHSMFVSFSVVQNGHSQVCPPMDYLNLLDSSRPLQW